MKKKKILIIDDDPGITESLRDIFEAKGYFVSIANKGSEAIDRLKKTNFNTALIDIKLPDMSGMALLKELKKINSELICMIITGYASVENAVNALELGASSYIIKPLDIDDVLNRIKEALEKQQLRQELKESEEKYRLLIETTGDIVLLHDANGYIKFANQAGLEYTGFSKTESLNHNIAEFIPEDEIKKMQKRAALRHAGNAVELNIETVFVNKAGNRIKVDVKGGPIFKNGKFFNELIIARDITLRKQTEEALLESEEKYRTVFENTGTATVIIEEDMTISMLNTQFEKLSGYSKEEIKNKMELKNFVIPEDLERVKKFHLTRREAGEKSPNEHEFRMIDRKGKIKNILLKIGMIPNTKKSIASLVDITELKKTQEGLRESKEEYFNLFNNANDLIHAISPNGKFLAVNKKWLETLEYSQEEVKDMGVADIIRKDKIKQSGKRMQEIKEGKSVYFETVFISKSGKEINVEARGNGLFKNGKFASAMGIFRDINERKQAEERIKHLNLIMRTINNINKLIVKETDLNRLIKKACKNLTKIRGYYNAWIVLLDEEGKLNTYAENNLGNDFLPVIQLLKKGKMIICIQKALRKKRTITTQNQISSCPECPLSQKYSNRGAMTALLKYKGKVYGVMSVTVPDCFIDDKEEYALFEEVAGDLALGLHGIELKEKLDKHVYDLKERVKEINCLFQMSQLFEKTDISMEEIIQRLTSLLPVAWQYPEITCARIILEGKEYKTENFKETIWKLRRDIKINKKIIGALEVYYLEERPEVVKGPFLEEEKDLITIIVHRLESFIDRKNSVIQLEQSYQKLKVAMDATINIMSKIIEAKDPYTAGHQQRVSRLAIAIARELNLSQSKIEGIRIASLIHDIGKIGIPTEILSKPSKLSEIEFSLIKSHSQAGHDILKTINFSFPIAQIVLQHHERLNGSGYPNHLKGDKILLEAKIIGIADVVEAISSHRPYRPALGIDKALEEITQNKGTLYDPDIVDICIGLFKEKEFKFE